MSRDTERHWLEGLDERTEQEERNRLEARQAHDERRTVKAQEAMERVDAACDELGRVHDLIKHGKGVEADFPYEHVTGGNEIVQALEEADYHARKAARLLSKLARPPAKEVPA